tara:strand:+ start:69 stop:1118 length:1050 start_codon:yes stop_codon:yes gene_type:complete
MTIKHIVLCGGGPIGIVSYGAIKELMINKIINYKDIKSIYSTSIGCFISLIILFNLNFEWIDDFIVKRPWENLINFSSTDYFSLFFTKGLCDENFFINCFKPLFLASDIPIDITLKQFYEINKIDWHIFTSNLNKFSKVDLNHNTYPNLTVIEAIAMSASIPILFKPPFYNNEYYLDGGMFTNCPSYECLINEKCNEYEMITFINDKRYPIDLSNNYFNKIENDNNINDISDNNLNANTNILSFLIYIVKTVFKKVMIIENENSLVIKNTINVCITPYTLDINYWTYVFSNKEERIRLIKLGESQASKFINNYQNNYDSSYNTININNDISFNLNDIRFENIILQPPKL